ncbi:MAG: septum formation initiator family protein [Eubacteriales bacterium]
MHWKNNVFLRTSLFLLVVFCIVAIVTLQLEYNRLRTKRDALMDEISQAEERVNSLEEALDTPFDDDYVIKVAREKLNYRLPEEIVFYNDLVK